MSSVARKIFIVILNWNRLKEILECLESVYRLDYPRPDYRVLVVDNASTDGSLLAIRRSFPEAVLIQNDRNLGFTGGCNAGMRYALERGADYVWLLNNDAVVPEDCLRKLVSVAESCPTVGLVSPLVYDYHERDRVQFPKQQARKAIWFDARPGDDGSGESLPLCLWGTALLVKAELVRKIGFLRQEFFAYYEDDDYCIRSWQAGYGSIAVPGAAVYHRPPVYSARYSYYMTRNRFMLLSGYLRGFKRFAHLSSHIGSSIREAEELRLRGEQERSDACLEGLWDALVGARGEWDRSRGMPGWIRRLLRWHPYFLSDLLLGNILTVAESFRARLLSLPLKLLRTWGYQVRDRMLSACAHDGDRNPRSKITLVIPVLCKGKYIHHFDKLRTLLTEYLPEQKYQNYEALVSCNGPHPEVQKMIHSLGDPRIRVCWTDQTSVHWGHPQTRLGITLATGEFFVRMNADNCPHAHYLDTLARGFERGIGIVYGRVIFKGEARKTHCGEGWTSFVLPQDRKGALKYQNIDAMNYMVRMDLAKQFVESWSNDYAADWIFLDKLLQAGTKFKFVDRIIGDKL